MEPEIEELTIIYTKQIIKLRKEEILQYLQMIGIKIPNKATVDVFFVVPTGADWSGMQVDIDKDNPIVVNISNETRK